MGRDVTDNDVLIMIEPADEHRQAFARWCLAQNPQIRTTSSTGSEVPASLFPYIPDELLHGAYIDGHVFRPVIEGKAPDGDGYRDEPPSPPAAMKTTGRRRNTRKADSK